MSVSRTAPCTSVIILRAILCKINEIYARNVLAYEFFKLCKFVGHGQGRVEPCSIGIDGSYFSGPDLGSTI